MFRKQYLRLEYSAGDKRIEELSVMVDSEKRILFKGV